MREFFKCKNCPNARGRDSEYCGPCQRVVDELDNIESRKNNISNRLSLLHDCVKGKGDEPNKVGRAVELIYEILEFMNDEYT